MASATKSTATSDPLLSSPSMSALPSSSSTPSSSTVHHSFSIKLNNSNYLAWKTQFTPLLNYYDLHGIIDDSISAPPKTIIDPTTQAIVPNPSYQPWYLKDQLMLGWILSSLSEEAFIYVIGLDSSHEIGRAHV